MFTGIISHVLMNVNFLIPFFFLLTEAQDNAYPSSNSCKNAQETLNKNMAWRKLMKLLIVCVTNEKTVDDSGFFLQALMSHENDRKLIFLMEQVL